MKVIIKQEEEQHNFMIYTAGVVLLRIQVVEVTEA
jgi:hypothetical protein